MQFSQWKTQRYTFLLFAKWQQNKALDQCIKERQRSDTSKTTSVNTRIFGFTQLGCRLNVCSLTPGCQNSESRCARFERVNRRRKEGREKNTSECVWYFRFVGDLKAPQVKDIVSCSRQERSWIYIAVSDQMWSLARENLKAVVGQNDIHEKQWKTELRLIRVMMTLQAEQSN